MKRLFLFTFSFLATTLLLAQGVKPLPTLHVDGRWLKDTHDNRVVLHGVMDTPNAWFNGGRWGWDYSDNGMNKCINYFEKIFTGLEKAKCDVFRLHMDPAWTNDPAKQSDGKEGGEADISRFSSSRLIKYLRTLYFPLAKRAMNHGMYVVVRPPGVCPGNLKVGDYYQDYLMTVWDIFSKNDSIRKYAGQISIELANEPVSLKNSNGEDDAAALHDYFQPIVDKIRANGFTGIIWAPGTGWQANYTSYASHPIEGYNIGYAVHDYTGWFGCSDNSCNEQNYIRQFRQQVPVVDTAPIIITEVDWSPGKSVFYVARLRQLLPDTTYHYRVCTNGKYSDWYSFRTYPAHRNEFEFVYVGDVQDSINGKANELLKSAFHQHPNAEMLVCGGDLTERPSDNYWEETFRDLDSICQHVPLLVATGNHDYLKTVPMKLERRFSLTFSYFLDAMEGENQLYNLRYANAEFFLLDSNREPNFLWTQRSWLKKKLQESKAQWKIVILHHPLYSLKGGMNNLPQRLLFDGLIREYGVDLVLQAHEHEYARMTNKVDVDGASQMMTTPVYTVSHCSPKNYRISFPDEYDRFGLITLRQYEYEIY